VNQALTEFFKNTNINIAQHTSNTVENHMIYKQQQHTDVYNKSGIYELQYTICDKMYIGQTCRRFWTRYKEHIGAIRYSRDNWKFTCHILNPTDSYGPVEEIMEMIKVTEKIRYLDTLENYCIHRYSQGNNWLNETHVSAYSSIFNTLYSYFNPLPYRS
jgi:hypothetical protein